MVYRVFLCVLWLKVIDEWPEEVQKATASFSYLRKSSEVENSN